MEAPERKRPSLGSAASSATLLSNLLFSAILAAACFMPAAVGCDKKTSISPIGYATSNVQNSEDSLGASLLGVLLVLWPYLFGAAIAMMLIVIAIARPKRLGHWLFPVPLTFLLALTAIGLLMVCLSDDNEARTISFFLFFLPAACILCFSGFAFRRHGSFPAAIRAIGGLAMLASLGVYLDTLMMQASRFLYGFYLSMIAAGGLLASSWLLYSRGERCFSNQDAPLRPTQFGVRALLTWTLVVAILITGYQALLNDDTDSTSSGFNHTTIEEPTGQEDVPLETPD